MNKMSTLIFIRFN